MTASIRERACQVLMTSVCGFLVMATLISVSTVARNILAHPQPLLHDLTVAVLPVTSHTQVALVPRLALPSYRAQELEAQAALRSEERAEAAARRKKADEEAQQRQKGRNEKGEGDSLLATAAAHLRAAPVVGPALRRWGILRDGDDDGGADLNPQQRQRARWRRRRLAAPALPTSPYVNATTGELDANVEPPPPGADVANGRWPAQLLPCHRRLDRVAVYLSGAIDVSPLWEWTTKAVYLGLLVRYSTAKTDSSEMVFLDAIVRDAPLPWALRHLRGRAPATLTAGEQAALAAAALEVPRSHHDAPNAQIDHLTKRVVFNQASKYILDDLYADTLAGTEVEVVLRYQVMSYSGWAPVLEMQLLGRGTAARSGDSDGDGAGAALRVVLEAAAVGEGGSGNGAVWGE